MKKFTVFIIGGIALLMSCAADPALDSAASIYEDKERLNSDIHITSTEPEVKTTIELIKNIIGLTFGKTAPGK